MIQSMRALLFVYILTFLPLCVMGQTLKHSFKYLDDIYTFELPSDFIATHSHYADGEYYRFYRVDSVSKMDTIALTIHIGSNVRLPHLSGSTYNMNSGSTFMSAGTQTNGRQWKEYNLPGNINIFYQNASFQERRLLDPIVEDLVNQIKESPYRFQNPSNYILDHFKLTSGLMFSKKKAPVTASSLFKNDQFNLSLSDEPIDFEISHHVLKNPYYTDDFDDESENYINYPLSYSVIYEGKIVSLFSPGRFVCHDLETLERDVAFEKQLNDRKFKYHWILNGALVARTDRSIYIYDKGKWTKSKIKYLLNDRPKLFEDEHFIAFKDCMGEWGGTVYFFDKHSSKIFFTEASCANSVLKKDNEYYILSHLGHIGLSELKSISDPRKLSISQKYQIGKVKDQGDFGYSDASKAFNKVFDFFNIQLFSTFTHDGQQLYIGHLNDLIFLAKIDSDQIEIVHPLFANNLYTHEPVTQKYGEQTLINLDHYGTAKQREVSMILIQNNRLMKIDWNKNQRQ